MKYKFLLLLTILLLATGCQGNRNKIYGGTGVGGPTHDRPFPLGQASDSFWETQQTNAEAADFIFYDHEFVGDTVRLTPAAKQHLEQVALRLEHVPFPVVIEESTCDPRNQLDQSRRQAIIEHLARMGVQDVEKRVVLANAFPAGFTGTEAIQSYTNGILSGNSRGGRGGGGGSYR